MNALFLFLSLCFAFVLDSFSERRCAQGFRDIVGHSRELEAFTDIAIVNEIVMQSEEEEEIVEFAIVNATRSSPKLLIEVIYR